MLIVVSIITALSTLAGGLFALHLKDKAHFILAFSAGAVMGVVFFDLLPEAFSLSGKIYGSSTTSLVTAVGFVIYLVLDRMAVLHSEKTEAHISNRGKLGVSGLSIHSFLDGLAIGIAFQFSASLGILIAVAVIVHDFSDGVNTVTIVMKNSGQNKEAFTWLVVDALAPVAGVISTLFFKVPETLFGLILALFAGFFLYIGASDLLPESQHKPSVISLLLTIAGMSLIYAAIKLTNV